MKSFDSNARRGGAHARRLHRISAAALGALLALWLAVPVAIADEGEAPLVLTLEDLERVAARKSPGLRTSPASPGAGFIRVQPHVVGGGGAPAGVDGASPGGDDRVAASWHEEYFRLKALALKQAIERGEDVHFGDAGPPASPSDAAPAEPRPAESNGPSCVYDRTGKLLHAPPGADCHPNRRRRPASQSTADQVCIFGIRGEVLHAPAGRDCDAP